MSATARKTQKVERVLTKYDSINRATKTATDSPIGDGGDLVIRAKLEACKQAVEKLPAALAELQTQADTARDEIERGAYLWKKDNLDFQVRRAAEIAEMRLAKMDSLATDDDYAQEKARCEADTLYWFRYYAWGYDPRVSLLPVQPYVPYEHQEPYIEWLDRTVFVRRTSGVVEKSRDEGATVGALNWAIKHWLFRSGFAAFVVSATEDLVDSNKDLNTLFEKVRFGIRLTPSWMLPPNFNLRKDLTYMNVHNSETDATISGGAPTERVGRQRRATVVIADEFQSWPNGGYKQNVALSMTSDSLIKLGTPLGTFNQYYDDTHAPGANVLVLDWKDNPRKDERWYNALPFGYVGIAMTAEAIAQEVDRNYEASQPGRVIKEMSEPHTFITWRELVAGFEQYGFGEHFKTLAGDYTIPEKWKWGRVSDFGESARTEDDTHIWAYSLFSVPSEGYPFTDTVFFFASLPVEPIGCKEEEGFRFYSDIERTFGLRNDRGFTRKPDVSDFSHEALDAKKVLLDKFGDNWNIPDLDFDKGRRKLLFHLGLTDKSLPNPFRPQLQGRSRLVFVAPDREYSLQRHERDERWFVTPSESQWGYKRLRREMQAWHYPPEERGKAVPAMRPKAVFDDIITTVRYAMARYGVDSARMSDWEKTLSKIPKELRPDELLAAKGTTAFPELAWAANHAMNKVKMQEEREEAERQKAWSRAGLPPMLRRRRGRQR
jgi:hypothetical protein